MSIQRALVIRAGAASASGPPAPADALTAPGDLSKSEFVASPQKGRSTMRPRSRSQTAGADRDNSLLPVTLSLPLSAQSGCIAPGGQRSGCGSK
jgi:hypothetical protein